MIRNHIARIVLALKYFHILNGNMMARIPRIDVSFFFFLRQSTHVIFHLLFWNNHVFRRLWIKNVLEFTFKYSFYVNILFIHACKKSLYFSVDVGFWHPTAYGRTDVSSLRL